MYFVWEPSELKKSPHKMYERNAHTKCMRDPRPMYFVGEPTELKKSPHKMYERNPHTKCMRDPRPMYFAIHFVWRPICFVWRLDKRVDKRGWHR